MTIQTIPSPFSVAEYCAGMDRREIITNPEYQRSDQVWPSAARSFLIETILAGFPIPKLYLFQKTDLKSKKTIKEIIDGQQRSKAIKDFFDNKLRLGKNVEVEDAKGKIYDELPDVLKQRFLEFPIATDVIISATPQEVREVFRRMNSYTVPLNPSEQRHAVWQGEFKWFIYDLTREYDEQLVGMGVFGEKQVVRMLDAKLLSDIVFATLNGIATTKEAQLDRLYKEKDKEFPEQADIRSRISVAMTFFLDLPTVFNSDLMKPHMFFTLLLAVMHCQRPIEPLQKSFHLEQPVNLDLDIVAANLAKLAEDLSHGPDEVHLYDDFWQASSQKTNVEANRNVRFRTLCAALEPVEI